MYCSLLLTMDLKASIGNAYERLTASKMTLTVTEVRRYSLNIEDNAHTVATRRNDLYVTMSFQLFINFSVSLYGRPIGLPLSFHARQCTCIIIALSLCEFASWSLSPQSACVEKLDLSSEKNATTKNSKTASYDAKL